MAEVKQIEVPKEWESENDWDSHRPMLWLAVNKIPHNCFIEMGMGQGSTPILKKWYKEINSFGKEYYSFETNNHWARKYLSDDYKPYQRPNSFIHKNHCIIIPEDYSDYGGMPQSLVFIDSAPGEQRKYLIERGQDANAIIIHDTEIGAEYVYGLSQILSTFKYRLDYIPEGKPATTIVSNIYDVTKWMNQNSTLSSIADIPNDMETS